MTTDLSDRLLGLDDAPRLAARWSGERCWIIIDQIGTEPSTAKIISTPSELADPKEWHPAVLEAFLDWAERTESCDNP